MCCGREVLAPRCGDDDRKPTCPEAIATLAGTAVWPTGTSRTGECGRDIAPPDASSGPAAARTPGALPHRPRLCADAQSPGEARGGEGPRLGADATDTVDAPDIVGAKACTPAAAGGPQPLSKNCRADCDPKSDHTCPCCVRGEPQRLTGAEAQEGSSSGGAAPESAPRGCVTSRSTESTAIGVRSGLEAGSVTRATRGAAALASETEQASPGPSRLTSQSISPVDTMRCPSTGLDVRPAFSGDHSGERTDSAGEKKSGMASNEGTAVGSAASGGAP